MDARTREQLRIVVSVALALVPRALRRDFSEKLTSKVDPAKAAIAERVVEAVETHFAVEEKEAGIRGAKGSDYRGW